MQTNLAHTYRITPACAGSTIAHVQNRCNPWDHPRLRGEYGGRKDLCSGKGGSPPLARGVPRAKRASVRESRITPACAGSTEVTEKLRDQIRDHPRLRGEYTLPFGITCPA